MNLLKIMNSIILFFAVYTSISAQEKMRIAVLDLKSEGVSAKTTKVVSNMLRTDLINIGSFTVVERNQMDNILKEQGFQQTGCTDQECAVQLGRLMSAKKILVGELSALGDEFIISIRIVDVEKGIAEFAAREKSDSINKLDQAITALTEKLSNSILDNQSPVTITNEKITPTDKVVTIKFSTFFPPSHQNANITDEWCREVENRTTGRVKTTHYTGGTLTPAPQTYDSIVQGIADAGTTVLNYTIGKFPLSEILDYPIGYGSGSAVASNLANEYYKKFKPNEFGDVKVMYFHSHAWGILHTNKLVNKFEDLEGIKIRAYGFTAEFIKKLGAVPVAMQMSEAYDSLSKGVIEGILCPYESIKAWKFGEVLNYSIENTATAYTATFIVAMNKEKWASISPRDQKTIESINAEYVKKQAALWDKLNNEGKTFMLQRGNKVIKLSAQEQARWIVAAQPLYAKYVAKMREKNLPGDQVLKFVQNYLNKYQNSKSLD
jgi:TRAP-type transport system periplasmic protein